MADDIKVKLGLDVGALFANLDKVVSKLSEVANTADKAEKEIGQIDDQKIDIDTTQAKSSLEGLSNDAKGFGSQIKEAFSAPKLIEGLSAGFTRSLASGGIDIALQGITALGGAIFDGAVRADEFGDKLEVAFSQQGVKDIQGEIEKVRASSLGLANDLGMPVERTRELASTVAQLGGVTGAQAEGLTKLAAGIETFTDGTVKGEAVAKAFSRGLADPEGAAAIEALSKKYPQLAETLKSTLSPTEKLAEANKILGTSFETVKNQQSDAGGTFNKLSNSVSEAFEKIGSTLNDVLNTIIPIFTETLGPAFADLSNSITGYFERIWSVAEPIWALIGGAIMITIGNIINVVTEVANVIFDNLIYAFDQVVGAVQPLIDAIKSALGIDGAMGEGIDAVQILQDVMNGFAEAISIVFDVVAGF
jgi:methyl-accepting chemotaxis protein